MAPSVIAQEWSPDRSPRPTSPIIARPEHQIAFAPQTRLAAPSVCVVAEIGVNHDGKIERALQLTEAAAQFGADAVKFQLFDPNQLLSNQARLAKYQCHSSNSVFDMLQALRLTCDELMRLRMEAKRRGLGFMVTVFSLEAIEDVKHLDPDAIKIASPDAVNVPLLRAVASLNKRIVVSTGTCTLSELSFAAGLLRDHRPGGCLLQCVSSYPTPVDDAGLGGIEALAQRYRVPVGYSDHTVDTLTGPLAVAAGACLLEKHLTYDRTADGPDHASSFDPPMFAEYLRLIRRSVAMLGPRAKDVKTAESDVRWVSRQSLCAKSDLPAGHVLTAKDLTLKRPGTGIAASMLATTLGRRLEKPVGANDLLHDSDLA